MGDIAVRLFDRFALSVQGEERGQCSGPAKALLALLLCQEGRSVSRAELARHLWPGRDPDRSLFYLRRTLTQLREALGPERQRVQVDSNGTVRLETQGLSCDLTEFYRLIKRQSVDDLRAAVSLYSGPFLPEVRGDWAEGQRQHAHEALLTALDSLGRLEEAQGKLNQASLTLRRLIREDPLREEGYRCLMAIQARQRRLRDVTRTYEEIRTRLRKELGIPTSPETADLYARLIGQARLFASPAPPKVPATTNEVAATEAGLISSVLVGGALDREDTAAALRLVNRFFGKWRTANRLPDAIKLAETAIAAAGEDPSEELVEALFRTATAHYDLFRLDEAAALYSRAECMADELGLERWTEESLRARGDLAINQGRIPEGRHLLGFALRRARHLDDRQAEASCLQSLGYAAREAGEVEEALSWTRQALDIHQEMQNEHGRLWCLGSMGALLLQAGKFEEAKEMFRSALAEHVRAGNVEGQTWNLTMLADSQQQIGELADARESLNRALALLEPVPENLGRSWPLHVLGLVLFKLGELDGAESVLKQALDLARAAGANKLTTSCLIRLGEIAFTRGDPDEAAQWYEDAMQVVRSHPVALIDAEVEALGLKLNRVDPSNGPEL
jgi:DNA-binding SARP family transcriptional activator